MLCRSPLLPYARRPQTVPSLSDPCLQ
jgi:hypothetical protein